MRLFVHTVERAVYIAAKLDVVLFDDRNDFTVFGGEDAARFYCQASAPQRLDDAKNNVEQALARDPKQLRASFCEARSGLQTNDSVRRRPLAAAHPDEWLAWAFLRSEELDALHECTALAQLVPRLNAARHPKLTAAQLAPFAVCQQG